MTQLTDDEIRRNMRGVRNAIAQQELEGLTVSPETIADVESAARGEIDSDEVRRRIHARLEKQQGRNRRPANRRTYQNGYCRQIKNDMGWMFPKAPARKALADRR